MALLVIVLILVGLVFVGWLSQRNETKGMTPAERREHLAAKVAATKAAKGPAGQPISQVANRGAGVLACPVCGGGQFKARRSKAGRGLVAAATITTGIGGVAAAAVTKQKQVQCVTCGTKYKRS